MTDGDSIFFCLKPQSTPDEAAHRAPPSAPAPPPKQQEELCAKIAVLEAKIKKIEERDSASVAAAERSKSEARASQLRCAELERLVAGFKKQIEDSVHSVMGTALSGIAHGKEELGSLRARLVSVEEMLQRLDPSGLKSVSLSIGLFEGRLSSLEAGLAAELKERFLHLDSSFGETARKAGAAQETAAGSARRVEKLEERVAGLPYLESRLNAFEGKLESLYELEALAKFLKLSVEGMNGKLGAVMSGSAAISGENKKIRADFESLSRQVRQLTALFNQLRSELAFLMPKKQESGPNWNNSYGDI